MKNTKSKYETREQWLAAAVALMEPAFKRAGVTKFPKVRVSCGWPSSRGLSAKKPTIGECWRPDAAEDGVSQIFISPRLKLPLAQYGVLDTLAHELDHSCTPGAKHGKAFRRIALAIGLEGKMTSTHGGEKFMAEAKVWAEKLGPYPHSILKPGMRPVKKQTTRMVKCECKECGYTVRTSRKWLEDSGAVLCPCNRKPMSFEVPEELGGEDDDE